MCGFERACIGDGTNWPCEIATYLKEKAAYLKEINNYLKEIATYLKEIDNYLKELRRRTDVAQPSHTCDTYISHQ